MPSKSLSPVEAVRAALARIEAVDPKLNAFCHLDPDTTVADAIESERRWVVGEPLSPLDGVPLSIKDLMWLKGWPTRYGSRAESDAPEPGRRPRRGLPAQGGLRLHRQDDDAGIRQLRRHRFSR